MPYVQLVLATALATSTAVGASSEPSEFSFWGEYEQKYKHHIEEEIDLYLDHKQKMFVISLRLRREILGPFAGETRHSSRNAARLRNAATEPIAVTKTLFGLEAVGHGINWWDGSYSAQPLINWGFDLKNTYYLVSSNEIFSIPDEMLVVDTPLISRDLDVSYQENYNEYGSMRSSRFGFGVGYGGVWPLQGSRENGQASSIYRKETIRTAQIDTRAVFYSINLLPPSFLKLRGDISETFAALPRFDAGTRLIWFEALRRLGSHIVIGAELGGSAHMDSIIDTVEIGTRGSTWAQSQLKTQYKSFTSPDPATRKEMESALDPTFSKATESNFKFEGGDTTLPSYEHDKWLASLVSNLVPLRYRTLPLSDFFPTGTRLHEDLTVAINEFLVFSSPQPLAALNLGPEVEVGLASQGASISVSSRRCGTNFLFRWFICRKETWMIGGENSPHDFIFWWNDPNQQATVTLASPQYVKKLYAHVRGPGQFCPVTQTTMIAGHPWESWGAGGKPVTAEMTSTSLWPVATQSATFNFGPAPPGCASAVSRLRIYAIQQSAPAGGIEGINRFSVSGWAFDPIDPTRVTEIRVYVDGQLHASGSTGMDHPNVRASYQLPANARPGFNIALRISGDAMRKHEIYVMWKGVTQEARSNTMYLWSIQPPGRLLVAEPSRLMGWAYIHDQPKASYDVEVFVDGQKVATGTTGNVDSAVVRSVFSANAAYGFEIPLNITTAGVHTVTAVLIAPDGTRLQFEDPLTVDLRFPIGEIFEVTPGWVSGFAYNPNIPNQATSVEVYIDGALQARGKTTILLPKYNERYLIDGAHGFNISLRMQGGKLHMVSVYARVGVGLKLLGEKSVAVGLDDRGSSRVTNGIINFAGVGYNPCYGEWRLRVVDLNFKEGKTLKDVSFKDTNLYQLSVPDEYDFFRSSEQLFVNTTNIYRNIKEWSLMTMTSWKSGFSLGFFGHSSSYQSVSIDRKFRDERSRVVDAKRIITMFEMKAKPSELLPFTSYAGYELNRLPAYNVITRPQWFRFFDLFGLTYAKSLKLGGRMDFQASYQTKNTSNEFYKWEKEQSGFSFTFLVTLSGSWEHAQSEVSIARSFFDGLTQSVRFIGGQPEKFNVDESEAWMRTIRQNPTIIDMELESISELLWKPDQADRKRWFEAASADYMRSCTPEEWVCRRYNVANLADGARILHASSYQPGQSSSSLSQLLLSEGSSAFQFGDGDPSQYLVLDLGHSLKIKAIAVDLDPYPSDTGVWDFVRVDTSIDQSRWTVWSTVGDADGRVDVTKPHYDFPLLVEEPVRYVRFSFGAVRPETRRGAKILRVYAYSCA